MLQITLCISDTSVGSNGPHWYKVLFFFIQHIIILDLQYFNWLQINITEEKSRNFETVSAIHSKY